MKIDTYQFKQKMSSEEKAILKSVTSTLREAHRAKYASTLELALAVASDIEDFGLKDSVFIGGYATLAYLMNGSEDKEEIISSWRGSKDIDILSRDQNIRDLLSIYTESGVIPRPSHLSDKNIKKYAIPINERGNIKIDAYIVNKTPANIEDYIVKDTLFENKRTIPFFDINLNVPSIFDLISTKLSVKDKTNFPRHKDILDILSLRKILLSEDETDISIARKIDAEVVPIYEKVIGRY